MERVELTTVVQHPVSKRNENGTSNQMDIST